MSGVLLKIIQFHLIGLKKNEIIPLSSDCVLQKECEPISRPRLLSGYQLCVRRNKVVWFSVLWRVRDRDCGCFSCPCDCGKSVVRPEPTDSVGISPQPGTLLSPSVLISRSGGRRVCLRQFTSFNIAWTNHRSVVVWSFMGRAGRDKYSEKMVFPPKEWQASSLWLSLCLTWWFIRAVRGYVAYYGPLWPLSPPWHGAHATVLSFNVSPMSARKTSSFGGVPGHFPNHYLVSAALPHKGTTRLENRRNIRIHK